MGIRHLGADNTIVFSAFENLLQVSADGGTPAPLTSLGDGDAKDLWHQFPLIVPSTGDVIFTAYTPEVRRRLEILRRDTKERSVLVDDASGAVLTSSGVLLFGKNGVLMAASFDPARRTLGPTTALSEQVVVDRFGVSQLAASANGTMVYASVDPGAPVPELGWLSRSGTFTKIATLPAATGDVSLSPNGKQALVESFGSNRVYLIDLERGVTTPLPLGAREVETVQWHPDGKRITLGGAYLSLFDPDNGKETRLTPVGRPKRYASWTPDGRQVVYQTFEPSNDIYTLALNDDGGSTGAPSPLIATPAPENAPAISPDGLWIAYVSGDPSSGRNDVFVARFPEATGRVQISSQGGGAPFWSSKGDELFYPAPPGVLQRVPIHAGDRLQVGSPTTLFALRDVDSLAVSADGSRFLAVKQADIEPPRQLVVVQNWFSDLHRQVAPVK